MRTIPDPGTKNLASLGDVLQRVASRRPAREVTAEQVNEEHRLARESAETAVQHAIRCGELLIMKKAQLRHGEFMLWISKNCEFGQATATRYIKAARQNATGVAISTLSELFPSGREGAPPRTQITPRKKPTKQVTIKKTPDDDIITRDAYVDSPLGAEPLPDTSSEQERWETSCGNWLGDLSSVRAYWRREFGAWEKFEVPAHLVALAKEAAEELTQLYAQLSARAKQS